MRKPGVADVRRETVDFWEHEHGSEEGNKRRIGEFLVESGGTGSC